jgi:hypothetical protein
MTENPRWVEWLAAIAFAVALLMSFVPGKEAKAIRDGLLWFVSNKDNIPMWVNDLLCALGAIGMLVAVIPALWRRQWGAALGRLLVALTLWSLTIAIFGGYVVYRIHGWGWGTLWFFGWMAIALVFGLISADRLDDSSGTTTGDSSGAALLYVQHLKQAITEMGYSVEGTSQDSAFDLLALNYPNAVCIEARHSSIHGEFPAIPLKQLIKKAREWPPLPVLVVTNSQFPPNIKELAQRDNAEFITWRDTQDNDVLRNALSELFHSRLPKAS